MLEAIRLQHFKCYEQEIEIPFAKFSILYGKNGRGKSSLMQSVLLLSQTIREQGNVDFLHLIGDWIKLGSFEDVVTRNKQNPYTSFVIDIKAEREDMHMNFAYDPTRPTLARLTDIRDGDCQLMSEMGENGNSAEVANKNIGISSQTALQSFAYLKRLRFISANRIGPKNTENRQDYKDEQLLTPIADNLFNVLAALSETVQQEIVRGMSYVLSGASMQIKPGTDTIELLLDSVNGTDGFKPVNVGYGYSFVLPIILQVVTASSKTLIIIENPEAHLYPGAQSRLIEFMIEYAMKKELQFIIETHSDHIINGLRISIKKKNIRREDVSILFFDRDKDMPDSPMIEPIKVDMNGTLSKTPDDFMDEWTKQMLELL